MFFLFLFKLQANDNEVSSFECIDELHFLSKLETVYFERNPIAKDIQYRYKIKLAIPWLQKIDATLCMSATPN